PFIALIIAAGFLGLTSGMPVDNLDASQFADPEPATERFADSDYPADGGFADGDFSDSDFNDDSSFLGDDDLFT
ncbi:hypothetical protein K3Z97_25525, partial [Pseudomonas aeruginosa]|nr:hypothetical protein [Pseudomonas aeruginosa]